MTLRMGKAGALFLWVCAAGIRSHVIDTRLQTFVCLTAFFVCQTALQACSRMVFAFSRDRGTLLPSSCASLRSNLPLTYATCRVSGQWLLRLCFQVDTNAAASYLGYNDLQYPPRLVGICLPCRSKCNILTHSHGSRHLIHHPDSAPPHLPESPGSAVQARAVLPWGRPARMGG